MRLRGRAVLRGFVLIGKLFDWSGGGGQLDFGSAIVAGGETGLIQSYLQDLHRQISLMSGGQVATYIPELAKANPKHLGLAIATVDGATYAAGDADVSFTIQSISKPFMYGLALQDLGRDKVLQRVGVEPTGDAFNSTVLDMDYRRPFNPMVNAGAIAVSALVRGENYLAKRATMLDLFARFAGRSVSIDETVYLSEKRTGKRNRRIAEMMRDRTIMAGNVNEILDLYFSQCSVTITCRDLAQMAAALANGGVHPLTGETVLARECIADVLTVMSTCGMYNYAGQWSFEVGMPAKSGVSGAIIAVIPGQIGIAAFSPCLDTYGNSVRAIAACKQIASNFGLHVFRTAPNTMQSVRRELSGDVVRSKRVRTTHEREVLDRDGGRIVALEAQGPLFFGSAERLLRRAAELAQASAFLILDFRRVLSADAATCALLSRFAASHAEGRPRLVFAHVEAEGRLKPLYDALVAEAPAKPMLFENRDGALEWCENQIIASQLQAPTPASFTLGDVDLFRTLSDDELEIVGGHAQSFTFEPGRPIVQEGDEANIIFVIVQGAASVRLRLAGESPRNLRIATLSVGATVGEMALLDGGVRSADVIADERTTCYGISVEGLRSLSASHPALSLTIYSNLARSLAERLRAANREVRMLEQ